MLRRGQIQEKPNYKKYILVREDSERVEREVSEMIEKMEGKDLELKVRKPVRRYGKDYIMVDFQKPKVQEETAE